MGNSFSDRREFLLSTASLMALVASRSLFGQDEAVSPDKTESTKTTGDVDLFPLKFGLVTYLWGKDWDLPTLISNCEKAETWGVELRTTHAHGVEPALDAARREEVRKRFLDSSVTLVGLGSNERFDHVDPAALKQAIDSTKAFIRLSHDLGSSGVKVKPDSFHEDVPREKTIAQIGQVLNELGEYAAGFGQEVRLEVHGQCAELSTIKAIMDIATSPQVVVCWNSNAEDLKGGGLKSNFELVRSRFGQTLHHHEIDSVKYPWEELIRLLVESEYDGWCLLEASSDPQDKLEALKHQRELFYELVVKVQQTQKS